ncbi:hypothetical protein [Desulforapulum autotrophicum]|nr:hypothetical protein [Desulforapulum autotrophicum]
MNNNFRPAPSPAYPLAMIHRMHDTLYQNPILGNSLEAGHGKQN